jgi:outer membrane protein OmpA-like peptidoglycan-associated protein
LTVERSGRGAERCGTLAAAAVAALVLLLGTSDALAQVSRERFALDRHQPAPSVEDGFRIVHPETLGPWRFSVQLVIDYAHAPLVLSEQDGSGGRMEVGPIVEHRLLAHALFAIGLADRADVYVGLPVVFLSAGDEPAAMTESFGETSAPALSDPYLGVFVRLAGEAPGPSLGLGATLFIPGGTRSGLSGDGGVGFRGDLVGAFDTERVTALLDVGVRYRPARDFVSAELGTELHLTPGLQVHVGPVDLLLEIALGTTLRGGQAFTTDGTALETLLGFRYRHESGMTLGAGIGIGLVGMVGVPDARALFSLGFAPPRDDEEAVDDPDDGRDDEIVEDPVEDVCPPGGCGSAGDEDSDDDGVDDQFDRCETEPESPNGYNDDDGCPEAVDVTDTHIAVEPGILFRRRSATIAGDAEDALRDVAGLLVAREDIIVQVEGHAARDEGSARQALLLSERRASAVVRFLVEEGVSPDRLTAVGLGTEEPSQDDLDANRRVELRILEQRQ